MEVTKLFEIRTVSESEGCSVISLNEKSDLVE